MSKDTLYNDTKRNKKATAFYKSKQWKRMREYVFNRDMGLCQECLKQGGKITAGDVVHHMVELLDGELGWSLRLDETNLITVCHRCHNCVFHSDSAVPDGTYFDEEGQLRMKDALD